jgi:hypothetical protein
MINYKKNVNKLVKKFAKELKVDNLTAKQLTAKYLFDTMQGIVTSDFTLEEKQSLHDDYYNTFKALTDEIINESN